MGGDESPRFVLKNE